MSTLFQASKKFEKDIRLFEKKEHSKIVEKINLYCSHFKENPTLFREHAYRPLKIHLPDDAGSSLYVLRIDKNIRVILTLEDDPLFDQIVVTLLRVVRHDSLDKAFKGIVESLYQGRATLEQGDKNG